MIAELVVAIVTALGTITAKQFQKQLKLILGSNRNVKELYKLKSAYGSIQAVLADAEKRQVREELVRVWIEKIEDVSHDVDDLLLEWITVLEMEGGPSTSTSKICSLSVSPCFRSRRTFLKYRDFATRIKKINERLSDIAVEKDAYRFKEFSGNECFDRPKTVSFIRASDVVGREVDEKKVIALIKCGRNREKGSLNVVSVLAGVGTGKTALVQLIYNCESVETLFEKRIWVSVAGPFDEIRVAKAILEVMESNEHGNYEQNNYRELEPVMRRIRERVRGVKFLLVLDDTDAVDILKLEQLCESLGVGKAGSTVLMTTRKGSVAGLMGSTHRLGYLSADDSWTLFAKTAFLGWKREDRERLGVVGKQILEKHCQGSPLAIKIFGYELRHKKLLSYWEHVLNCGYSELKAAQQLIFPCFNQSYYGLAPNVKRCFSFCASFPKDHVIEADSLVQEWMTQGYLTSADNVEMEVVGRDYLQHLAMDSFLQVVEKNGERIVSVKMHATVHGFAQFLTKGACSVIEINTGEGSPGNLASSSRARHLTVVDRGQGKTGVDNNVANAEKLSTFRIQSSYDCPSVVSLKPELIRSLLRVRALDFSRNMMGEIPKEIGNLVHLHYLNLSHNPFRELPEALCDSKSLRFLKLSGCDRLRRLPQRIDKAVELRHLEIDGTDSLMMLPKGIAYLASLRTLSKFIVSPANDACGIAALRNLNKLRGHLKMEGLGNATDAAEAKKAELSRKIHLTDLEMDFRPLIQNASQDGVIEALEPSHNLQSLQITSYQGTQLPKWMMKLPKLRILSLQDCLNCTSLPPSGRLALLVALELEGMKSVKCLDLRSAFPHLEKIKVSKMESLQEWNVSSSDGCLPHLRSLEISHCNMLRALPPLLLQNSPLKKLSIHNCPLLYQRYNEETGTHRSDISPNTEFTLS